MRKIISINRVLHFGLVLLFVMLNGCAEQPVATIAPESAPTETPAGTNLPEENSADWLPSVTSLCIQVEQTYSGVSGHTEPIAEEIQGILERIGVRATIGETGECEAKLALTMQFTPSKVEVSGVGGGECYLDVALSGMASLSAAGHKTLTRSLDRPVLSRSPITQVSECPKKPDQAPFAATWSWPVTGMLQEWWGSPALVAALKSNSALRWAAVMSLPGTAPEAIPALAEMLEDPDLLVRFAAAKALANYGPAAAEAVPALVEVINDPDHDTQYAVFDALVKIGGSQARLAQKLGEADPQVRAGAAITLGMYGPAAAQAVPALLEVANDNDPSVRHAVITALGDIGDSQAVPALIEAFHHSDLVTRIGAVEALIKLGPKAAPAVPDLIDAIDDEFEQIGWSALEALGAIGPEARAAVPVLIEQLENEDRLFRSNAVDALKKITGQDFGEDAAAWRQWWESQP